jgi:hypothetical protein
VPSGKKAIAGRVDDAAPELADERQHRRLMPLEVAHGPRIVRAHQRAIADDVGGQNCGELPGEMGCPSSSRSIRAFDQLGQRIALLHPAWAGSARGGLRPAVVAL